MRKIYLFLVILVVVFISTSCGIGVGFAQTHGGTSLNYQVPVKNMKFKGEVSAKVKGHSVFCVFPTYDPLMDQAMKKLNKNAGLKTGHRAVFNVRVDVEDKFYFVFCTRHVTVSGDVYDIIDDKYIENAKAQRSRKLKAKLQKQKEVAARQAVFQKKQKEASIKQQQAKAVNERESKRPRKGQKCLIKYWNALENGSLAMIKNEVVYSLMSKPGFVKQEGFYFLGDVALIEKDIAAAKNHYKKGLLIEGADKDALMSHLIQFGELYPDLKPILNGIYTEITKGDK